MTFMLSVLGAVLIIEGLPYFAFPVKLKSWGRMMEEVPPRRLRLLGLISMAAGLVLLYLVRVV